MIDTIKLKLNDYEISKKNSLIVRGSDMDFTGTPINERLLYTSDYFAEDSFEIKGSRAFYNHEKFNVSLGIMANNEKCLVVQTSIPRLHNGNNFYSVGLNGLQSGIRQLEKSLSESGIKTDILNSKLLRVDAFKNVLTDEHYLDYSILFRTLRLARKQTRDYGTTHLFFNKQEEICIYDKIAEMRDCHKLNVSDYPENVMRFEYRLLKAQKIQNKLGYKFLYELVTKDGYTHLKEVYKGSMMQSIFKYEPDGIRALTTDDLYEEIKKFKILLGRNYVQGYLELIGLKVLIQDMGYDSVLSAFKHILSDESVNTRKTKIKRIKQKLQEAEKILTMSSAVKDKTVLSLYQELKDKVLS